MIWGIDLDTMLPSCRIARTIAPPACEIVFRTELVPSAATFVAGLAAVALGVQFVRSRGTGLVAWSGVLGLAWAALYGFLAVAQVQDPAALLTDVGVGLIGAGAAVAGARSTRRPA